MNSKGIVAIKDTKNLCYKCLKKKGNIHKINIGSRGYGSYFDNMSTYLQLCDNCYKESQKDKPIWDMKSLDDNDMYDDSYLYDNEMSKYLHNLPLESQELVFNRNSYGACAGYNMDSQDWIDFELDELPHEKCKEYCLYSPKDIEAYNTKFTTCEYVANVIFDDNSKASWCPFGASGDYGQKIDKCGNLCDKCTDCKFYKKRETVIKEIKGVDLHQWKHYMSAKLNEEEYKKKFD